MHRIWRGALAAMLAGATVAGQSDADKILAEVREALGGEKLAAVKTMTVIGRTQRTTPAGISVESEFEMALELPDKFMRRDVLANLGNMSVYRTSGFNGDAIINEIDTPPSLTGGGNFVMRFAGPGMPPGPGGVKLTPEQEAAARRGMLLAIKQDFVRMALGMFPQSFSIYPLTMTHVGQAESPDGKADVIEVTGEGDFVARLFIDSRTHLPLMLSWMAKEPISITRSGRGGTQMVIGGGSGVAVPPPPARAQGGDPPAGTRGQPPTPEEQEKLAKELAAQMREAREKARVVEYRIYYGDYKSVDGVKIPHRFQRAIDGKPTEETTFERVRLNQKIDPRKFEVSK